MDITLNGEALQVSDHCTVSTLLETRDLTARRVAVEVNGTIVPRSAHDTHALAPGDQIEIVHALGGG